MHCYRETQLLILLLELSVIKLAQLHSNCVIYVKNGLRRKSNLHLKCDFSHLFITPCIF